MIKAETIPGRFLGALAVLAALSGCAGSPPVRYYTLTAPEQAIAPAAGSAGYAIDVAPVSVPAQADQPQLMLRSGSGELTAQYSDRWSAPLPNELRNALSIVMTRQLGVPDIRRLASPPGLPVWRVQVDVQRFDASTAGPAVIDATWRVRPLQGTGAGLLCRSRVEVPVQMPSGSTDLAPVVVAEQKAVALLGFAIASAVRSQGKQAIAVSTVGHAQQCMR
ncbi:membrane integrity-associated transporter subunit PqiC [Bordetella sp. FB-8]|uniref:PqiC family protein n=1 Tax=Bordetella sp. FB-8 TaxID=1159870 RepID=UPI00035C1285|nr:PqiC family protein [Bordetella sp. FB-8]